MARKNLKSMGMKNQMSANSSLFGGAPNLAGGLLNNSGLNNSSQLGEVSVKLDPKIEEEYESELFRY